MSTVILIHGLGRTQRSLKPLGAFLQRAGFDFVLHDYKSRRYALDELLAQLHATIAQVVLTETQPIHFVTHSLGGILLRAYLSRHSEFEKHIGRIVMLAPPNHGSEVIDFWRAEPVRFSLFKKFMGEVAVSLHTGDDSLPNSLPLLEQYDVGIINGSRSADPWFNHLFYGAHDGKVSAVSSRLHERHPVITHAATHTFMMNQPAVRQSVLTFLQNGSF